MPKLQPPRGTRDFLPEEMIKRKFIVETIEKTFQRYGFQPVDTPAFETWKLLAAKGSGGEEIKNEIYYFKDKSGRELGLRFDLTVPTARLVASNPQIPKPFKRYQIGKVWRYDRPQAGRFREFLQADADVFGSYKMDVEAECIALIVDVLKQLGFKNLLVRLNNRKILNGFVKLAGIKNPNETFRILDKLEKIGKKEVIKQLKQLSTEKSADKLMELISIKGKPETILAKGRKLLASIEEAEEGITELEEILENSKTYGTADKITIDFSLVRGLDYYTGPIYEVSIKSKTSIGSIAGGGRYDKLVEIYGGKSTPASGFGFGVERISELMEDMNIPKTYTKIFVVPVSSGFRKQALKITQKLRKKIPADTDLMGRNLKKQMEYVNSADIPYALFVGEKEIKAKKFTLRDMRTGKEKKIDISKLQL